MKKWILCALLIGQANAQPIPPTIQQPLAQIGVPTGIVDLKLGTNGVNGAKGDTVQFTNGTMLLGSNVLSSPSASCKTTDIGKQIIVHGAGAFNSSINMALPLQGTITGCGGNSFLLSFNAQTATIWSGSWSGGITAPLGGVAGTPQSGSGSYAPADILTISGTVNTVVPTTFNIVTTQAWTAAVNGAGSGGTPGPCILTGTTGSPTKFQINATISGGGSISSLGTFVTNGSYTTNPTLLSAEPVTSNCSLGGSPTLTITMGYLSLSSNAPGQVGAYGLSNPMPTTTSGSGTGATVNISGFQGGGQFLYGTDDTAAVKSLISYATSIGAQVHVPHGAYWLESLSTPITLNNIMFDGDGIPANAFPFIGNGSTFVITNQSAAVFGGMSGVTMRYLAFYWPLQDGSQATPIAYPALFESSNFLNDIFSHNRFINPYQLLKVDASALAGAGLGRVFFDNNLAYCVFNCFYILNGATDVLKLNNNMWTVGAYGNTPQGGPATLAKYTVNNGEFIHIDINSANYKKFDGLQMSSDFIFEMQYGIRLISGTIDVSTITGVNWDQVPTALSLEGANSCIVSTAITGGSVYGINLYNPAATNSVFSFSGTNSNCTELVVGGGFRIDYAMGNGIAETGNQFKRLTLTGLSLANWGQSTTGPTTYYAVAISGDQNIDLGVYGSYFSCNPVHSNAATGVTIVGGSGSNTDVVGNEFANCTTPVILGGGSGTYRVGNNISSFTAGGKSVNDTTSGAATVWNVNNTWDKFQAPGVGTGAGDCGTSPSFAAASDDYVGRLTVGSSSNGGLCTVTFISQTTRNPVCSVTNETAVARSATSVASSAKVVVFTAASTFTAGDVLAYKCQR